jgi:hypothetical protein
VTEDLLRLARWLEGQPWNSPGFDKTWVLQCTAAFQAFTAERRRARVVVR